MSSSTGRRARRSSEATTTVSTRSSRAASARERALTTMACGAVGSCTTGASGPSVTAEPSRRALSSADDEDAVVAALVDARHQRSAGEEDADAGHADGVDQRAARQPAASEDSADCRRERGEAEGPQDAAAAGAIVAHDLRIVQI